MRASTILREERLHTPEATEVILIPASCRVFSRRCISWARASIWVLRYRVSSRSSRISGGGTKEGRTIPWAATSASHSASDRSVFRPGTFFTCWAYMLGVAQPQLRKDALQGVVDTLPVHPGGLHAHPEGLRLGQK